jgi:1-deoxyxylulose-5-phosphate synthase
VQKLQPLAAQTGISMSRMALAWVLRQRAVTSAIVGATNLRHISDSVAPGDIELSADLVDPIDTILTPVLPHEPYLA